MLRKVLFPLALISVWLGAIGGMYLLLRGEERFPSEWQDLSDGLPGYAVVTGLAVSVSDPELVYAAVYREGGVLTSRDGGTTWNIGRGLQDLAAYGVAVDPLINTRVFAATADGVYRSRDGGNSWERLKAPLRTAYAVQVDSRVLGRVLAGGTGSVQVSADYGDTWQAGAGWGPRETALCFAVGPSGLIYAGSGAGVPGKGSVKRSDDGGLTWQTVLDTPASVAAVAADRFNAGRVLALAAGDLFLSEDAGRTWEPVALPRPDLNIRAITYSDTRSGVALAGTERHGLWASADGGRTWAPLGGQTLGTITAVAFDATGSGLWAATDTAVFRSRDGGLTWAKPTQYPVRPLVRGIAFQSARARLFAATSAGIFQRDDPGKWVPAGPELAGTFILALGQEGQTGALRYAGTLGRGVWVSEDDGRAWKPAASEAYAATSIPALAPAPRGDLVFARTEDGRLIRSADGGETWAAFDRGLEGLSVLSVAAAGQPLTVYAGTNAGVYRFDPPPEGGEQWQPSGGTLPPGSVLAIAVDPKDPQRLWVGHTRGLFASEDGGRHWTGPAPILGDRDDRTVRALLLDLPWVYVGTQQDGIFLSKDAGKTWKRFGRIPLGHAVNQLVLDRFSGDVYAATEFGVYRWPAGQH